VASIVYDDFSGGLDLSRPANIQPANRFRELKNAYVTPGKAIRKRHGARYVWSWGPGVKGLFTGPVCLTGFWGDANASVQAVTSSPFVQDSARYRTMRLSFGALGGAGNTIERVHTAFLVADSMYVVAKTDAGIRHYFGRPTDVSANRIEDANCPNGPTAIPIASKVFAGDPSGIVRFSKTDDPKDWTAADDAGFLPTNRKTRSSNTVVALGEFDGRLVVSTGDAAQLWDVDPDPAAMAFHKTIAVGQVAGDTGANVGADLFFLSPSGVRSIVLNTQNANAMDLDVGVPVDRMAVQFADVQGVFARFFPSLGQFWLIAGSRALVYSFSRTAKVYAWSEYTFPWAIAGAVDFEGAAYLRSTAGDIYRLDDEYGVDDDAQAAVAALGEERDPQSWAEWFPLEGRVSPTVRVVSPYFDFKSPAALKQIHAMDVVATRGNRTGRFEVTHRFRSDSGSEVFEAGPIELSGLPDDSRPQGWIPVGIVAPSVAAVIEHEADEAFELSALIYHFDNLGVAG